MVSWSVNEESRTVFVRRWTMWCITPNPLSCHFKGSPLKPQYKIQVRGSSSVSPIYSKSSVQYLLYENTASISRPQFHFKYLNGGVLSFLFFLLVTTLRTCKPAREPCIYATAACSSVRLALSLRRKTCVLLTERCCLSDGLLHADQETGIFSL